MGPDTGTPLVAATSSLPTTADTPPTEATRTTTAGTPTIDAAEATPSTRPSTPSHTSRPPRASLANAPRTLTRQTAAVKATMRLSSTLLATMDATMSVAPTPQTTLAIKNFQSTPCTIGSECC